MDWKIPSLKDLEHYYWRCTACGTCRSAYDYGPPPSARPICPSGTEFGFEGYYSSKGKAAYARGISDGSLTFDDPDFLEAIYRCTVCGGCQNQCQVDYKPHIPEVIEAMRREAVKSGAGPMPLQKNLVQSMKNYNNPYQGPRRVRLDWTRPFKKAKTPIKNINKEAAEVLFYVGCTGAFNKTAMSVPQATARIFKKLGIDFGILGESEVCCGSTAMRVGDAQEFKRVATENLETFRRLHDEKGVKTIVTSCAGCFRAIKKDYVLSSEYDPMMDGIEVVHTVQFLHRLMKDGNLTFKNELPWHVTYHDPCNISRSGWILEQPRERVGREAPAVPPAPVGIAEHRTESRHGDERHASRLEHLPDRHQGGSRVEHEVHGLRQHDAIEDIGRERVGREGPASPPALVRADGARPKAGDYR